MEATYRQEREWLNGRGPINGYGTANYGDYGNYRGIGSFSGQSGQSQIPNQSHMGRTLSGLTPWAMPSMSLQSSAAPQANSNWSRDRPIWNNEVRREPVNIMNRSWPGTGGPLNGGPSNGSQWSTASPNVQSVQVPAEERGLPEHIRKELSHLSAAKRKWFYRFLDGGCSNEKALTKALEKRTTPYEESVSANRGRRRPEQPVPDERGRKRPEQPVPDERGRKRPNEDNSSGGRAREEPKKQRAPEPSSRALSTKQNGLTMAIMAETYPDCLLTNKQLHEIEDGLVEEMKKGWKSSINFGGIQFLSGLIQVVCMDKNSRQWLEHAVHNLTVLPETKLICCPEDEIPATKGISVYVPRSAEEPDEVTFELLKDQNTDLLSKTWEVGRISKSKDGKVVAISIGSKSYSLLQKNDFCLSYRFNQLTCRAISGSALKAVRGNKPGATKTNSETEAAESTVDSAEIDLTEEDGEEFISQLDLTVVDEVKGDDDDDEEENEDENEDENEITEVEDDVEEVVEDQHDDVEIIEGVEHDDVQIIEGEDDEEESNDDAAEGEHDEEENDDTAEAERDEAFEVAEDAREEQHEEEENGNTGVVEDETCSS
ncbi:uncharacterized protein LOC6526650 [Drosophila yakuba]|uniref:DUF4780 domain-containing protein n=1 Tax=Drosophila yakuba TaxID=7245 RepID=B4NXB3_DROYA|nr:uncharacterized protein LOC6526650 [Drosophila yakuba]EDW87470.1 uncharacterized protein Dyak_GE14972 [Drosophila yakuba]